MQWLSGKTGNAGFVCRELFIVWLVAIHCTVARLSTGQSTRGSGQKFVSAVPAHVVPQTA